MLHNCGELLQVQQGSLSGFADWPAFLRRYVICQRLQATDFTSSATESYAARRVAERDWPAFLCEVRCRSVFA